MVAREVVGTETGATVVLAATVTGFYGAAYTVGAGLTAALTGATGSA